MQQWIDTWVQVAIGAVALLALCVSAVALVPAIIGLVNAHHANRIARGANNSAIGANVIATQANALSSSANGIARDALEVTLGQERRQTEQHDVDWKVGWVDDHHLFIANIGLDTAHRVRYRILGVNGLSWPAAPQRMESRATFDLASDVFLNTDRFMRADIELRISWTSDAGAVHRSVVVSKGHEVHFYRKGVG